MPIDVAPLFTRNWPIKLAALFLALLLYVAVAAQQPISQAFTLRLRVQVPPGRALLSQPPGVSVQVAGRGGELLKLRAFPRFIGIAVPDTFSGTDFHLTLGPTDIAIPKGVDVTVTDISPRDLTFTLDSVARKDVRIVPRVTVVADSGFTLRTGLSISPSVARIVGSDRALAGIESVTTVPVQISNVTGSFTRTVAIDTMPLGIVRVGPKTIEVSGDIGPVIRRVFGSIAVETGAGGAPAGFTLNPAHVSVEVRGAEERLATLTRDSVKVIARLSGTAADGVYAHLTVLGPTGTTARAVPDSVQLKKKSKRG